MIVEGGVVQGVPPNVLALIRLVKPRSGEMSATLLISKILSSYQVGQARQWRDIRNVVDHQAISICQIG